MDFQPKRYLKSTKPTKNPEQFICDQLAIVNHPLFLLPVLIESPTLRHFNDITSTMLAVSQRKTCDGRVLWTPVKPYQQPLKNNRELTYPPPPPPETSETITKKTTKGQRKKHKLLNTRGPCIT